MRPGEGTTIIGRSAKLRGDLSGKEDLQIDGEFEGTIRLTGGRLTVGAEARVRASIVAPEVVVFGKVEGDIRATGRVDLRSTAAVLGDVFAARISIEEDATLRGYVDPSRAGEALPEPAAQRVDAARTSFARPAATQSDLTAVSRTPDLFDRQTSHVPLPGRQMPSALAAIAAAGRPGSGAEPLSAKGNAGASGDGEMSEEDKGA